MPPDTQDAEPAVYHVSLKGGGIAVDRDVPEAVAVAVVTLVMGGSAALPLAGGPAPVGRRGQQQGSLVAGDTVGEFVQASGASTSPEKIAAMALYLTDYRDKGEFSRAELKAQFRTAGEPNPSNFPRDLQKAVASRWIAPVEGSKDAFFVTNTGRTAVTERFEGSSRGVVSRPARRRHRKAPTTKSTPSE
jgi:hypothetical protein